MPSLCVLWAVWLVYTTHCPCALLLLVNVSQSIHLVIYCWAHPYAACQWFHGLYVQGFDKCKIIFRCSSCASCMVGKNSTAPMKRKVIWYQLGDILTECSSSYHSESEEAWTNIAVYSHAPLRIHIIGGQMSVKIASSSHRSSNHGLPVLHLGWSTPLRVSSGCVRPTSRSKLGD